MSIESQERVEAGRVEHDARAGSHSERSRAKRILGHLFGLLMVLGGVLFLTMALETTGRPADRDFISYWSSGQLLRQHTNPYSPPRIMALERAQGYSKPQPLVMRNPPWALFLVLPLGFLKPLAGSLLWILSILGITMISIRLLRAAQSKDHIFVYFFAPILACMMLGQSSAFLLLGFALFLHFHGRKPFVAGLALALMAIKPHLFLPFWLVLCMDSISRRQFRLLAGLVSGFVMATGVALLFDPHVWAHYLAAMRYEQIGNEFVQTPSYLLRALIEPDAKWLQFLPAVAGAAWAAWYYLRRRSDWQWHGAGLLLMPVSLLVSPYGALTDEMVLVPVVLSALYLGRKGSLEIFLGINGVIALLGMLHFSIASGAYIWTTTAWVLWYGYAQRVEGSTERTAAQLAS